MEKEMPEKILGKKRKKNVYDKWAAFIGHTLNWELVDGEKREQSKKESEK